MAFVVVVLSHRRLVYVEVKPPLALHTSRPQRQPEVAEAAAEQQAQRTRRDITPASLRIKARGVERLSNVAT